MEQIKKFPYIIDDNIPADVPEKWNAYASEAVTTQDGSKVYRVHSGYFSAAEGIYNFKVRPDDVWVVTYPRSGTTLTQEMVWLIANDDYEMAKKEPLPKRFPFLEFMACITDEELEESRKAIKDKEEELSNFNAILNKQWITLEEKVGRRFIKTHLPFALLPPELLTSGCKVIYIARNPKDVAVSSFKFLFEDSSEDEFPEFFECFINNAFPYNPYWDHVIQGWQNRNNKNYCFLFYENIVKDMNGTIKTIANFMEKNMTDQQVEKLAEHLHIDNFMKNKSVNRNETYYLWGDKGLKTVRKGGVGGWRNYFSDELESKANKWIEDNCKQTDLKFPVSLGRKK